MKTGRLLALSLVVAALTAGAVVSAAPKKSATPKKSSSKTAKPANDSDAVLVRIGNDVITPRQLSARLQELPEQYRAQYSTPDGRKQLLDRMSRSGCGCAMPTPTA